MARVRSPNYPALSLPEAIERVKDVHRVQQTTPEPREVVLQHMGYSGVNGRSLKAISALIKYGFLESTGDGNLRVSKRAIAILYPDPDNPKAKSQALLDAAHAPALFASIFNRWKSRPSDASLQSYLAHQGFNTNSVEQVAQAFYETYDLVSDLLSSYDSAGRLPTETDEDEDEVMEPATTTAQKPTQAAPLSVGPSINSTKPVFDFEKVVISTQIDNQEDLEELMSRLGQIKSMLPRKKQS